MTVLKSVSTLVLCALGCLPIPGTLHAAAPTDSQVKAVFVFNFSQFVDWPAASFATADQPFNICLLGADDMVALLAEAVRGEAIAGRPLHLRRLTSAEDAHDCRILYIGRERSGSNLARVLQRVAGSTTLTVSDEEDAARRGVMIQLANENNRIRLLVNLEVARAAGLAISSNLLRTARIVRSGQGG